MYQTYLEIQSSNYEKILNIYAHITKELDY